MTYKGDKPIMSSRTAMLITDIALINANFIIFCMLNRVCQALSILSFLMVTSVIGGGYFGYKYVTSEQFKAKMMNQVMGNVKGMMPSVLEKGLPKTTGKSIPLPKKLGL